MTVCLSKKKFLHVVLYIFISSFILVLSNDIYANSGIALPKSPPTNGKTPMASSSEFDPFDRIEIPITRAGVPQNPRVKPATNKNPLRLIVPPNRKIPLGNNRYIEAKDLLPLKTMDDELHKIGVPDGIANEHIWQAPEIPQHVLQKSSHDANQLIDYAWSKYHHAKQGYPKAISNTRTQRLNPGPHYTTRDGSRPSLSGVSNTLRARTQKEFGNANRFSGGYSCQMNNLVNDGQHNAIGIRAGCDIGGSIFKRKFSIVKLQGHADLPEQGQLQQEVKIYLLGQNALTLRPENSGVQFPHLNVDRSWPVSTPPVIIPMPIGPVPVVLKAYVNGNTRLRASIHQRKNVLAGIEANFTPSFEVGVVVEASVNMVTVSVGVQGQLTLLRLSMPSTAQIDVLRTQNNRWVLSEQLRSQAEITLGAGYVGLFVRMYGPPCWTVKAAALAGNLVSSCFEKATRGFWSKVKKAGNFVKNVGKGVAKVAYHTGKQGVKMAAQFAKDPVGTTIKAAKTAINVAKDFAFCKFEVNQRLFAFAGVKVPIDLLNIQHPRPAVHYLDEPNSTGASTRSGGSKPSENTVDDDI